LDWFLGLEDEHHLLRSFRSQSSGAWESELSLEHKANFPLFYSEVSAGVATYTRLGILAATTVPTLRSVSRVSIGKWLIVRSRTGSTSGGTDIALKSASCTEFINFGHDRNQPSLVYLK
jgi:hypothetical protein